MMTWEQMMAKMDKENNDSREAGYIVQEMYELVETQSKPVAIDRRTLYKIKWHNPDKGETMFQQFDRWLEFIKVVFGISHYYDIQQDLYIFTKIKS